MSKVLLAFTNHFQVSHKKSSPYHPQANRQFELTNRELGNILTKIVSSRRKDWAWKLPEAIWAYNTTWKSTMGYSPYELVFGKKPLLPIDFELQTLRTTMELGLDLKRAQLERVLQLSELDELCLDVVHQTELVQQQRKVWHDKHVRKECSIMGIGCCYLIPDIKITRGN